MSEPSKSLIVAKWAPLTGGGASLAEAVLSPAAQERISDLVVAGGEIEAVTSQAELELANQTLSSIARYVDDVEAEHKAQKSPFLSAGRAIDAAKTKALELILPLQIRLKAAARVFLEEEAKRQRDAEAARQREVKRLQEEKASADALAKKAQGEAAAAEAKRLADEKKLAEEKAAAEQKRIADEAAAIEAKRLADEKAAKEQAEREEAERQIAIKLAWDNSAEGQAEAARKREELARQQAESDAKAKADAEEAARKKAEDDAAAVAEQQRIAEQEAKLKAEREAAEALEKTRQQEAALAQSIQQTKIETVTAQDVVAIPTRWTFKIAGATEDEQKKFMSNLCFNHPHWFTITPNVAVLNKLAKEIKGGVHQYFGITFIEEVVIRTEK